MTNKKSNVEILDRLSFKEFPYQALVNERYPGVPVVATPKGWVLFRSLEDYYNYQFNK